jgi:hypothetical protein
MCWFCRGAPSDDAHLCSHALRQLNEFSAYLSAFDGKYVVLMPEGTPHANPRSCMCDWCAARLRRNRDLNWADHVRQLNPENHAHAIPPPPPPGPTPSELQQEAVAKENRRSRSALLSSEKNEALARASHPSSAPRLAVVRPMPTYEEILAASDHFTAPVGRERAKTSGCHFCLETGEEGPLCDVCSHLVADYQTWKVWSALNSK